MKAWGSETLLRVDRTEGALQLLEARLAPSAEISVRDFGGPVALIVRHRQNTLFNRATGLAADSTPLVASIVEHYLSSGIPPRLDVCPDLATPELGRALEAAGLEPSSLAFFSRRVLIGVPRPDGAEVSGVSVERVALEAVEAFNDIRNQGFPLDVEARARSLGRVAQTHAIPHRFRYFAIVDGERAAAAQMEIVGGVAYLNLGVTREAYRRRGCQTALIRRRQKDACAAGAQLVFSLVAPQSQSERNLRREGLEFAYDRQTWLPADWTEHPFYRDAG